MNNLEKVLSILIEKSDDWKPSENAIDDYAEKHNLSWGAATKALIAAHKEKEKKSNAEKAKADKAAAPKSCWGCGKDWYNTKDGKREGNSYLTKHKGKTMCPDCIEEYDQIKGSKEKVHKSLTDAKFRKMCKDAGKDFKADNPGEDLGQVAWDIADSLLHDPDIKEYCKKRWPKESKDFYKEMIADYIHG